MDVTVSRGTRQRRSEDDNQPFDNISVGTTLRVTDDVVIEGKYLICQKKITVLQN